MSLWILLAIVSYLLLAVTGIMDKFLVSKVERHPIVYAFYTGITGPFSLLLAPFGLIMLNAGDFFIAVMSGVCFTWALYFFFSAIQQTTVSRVLPIQGGLVPSFTLVLAYFLLGERLLPSQLLAFGFLIIGAVLISLRHDDTGWHPTALKNAIIAAFLFAASFTFSKYIFDNSNFITGMVWTRLGFFVTALAILASKQSRKYIFNAPKQAKAKNIVLYYSARANGTIAGFLQNYAISLGSVTIVNAMQGVQFVFLLGLTTALSVYYPAVLKENLARSHIIQKVIAIIFISVGLVILST
jgi:drug/metabolite transporter (DMT)-like permease